MSISDKLISQVKGQFILTTEERKLPDGWQSISHEEWNLLTSSIPVIDVFDESENWLGWCLGHPIVDGRLETKRLTLNLEQKNQDDICEDFYNRASGRWALLLVSSKIKRVYLDPYGSLALVFSIKERTVASTPSLIGSEDDWDKELMKELGFPDKIRWLPSGLTFKKGVRRLLPNHFLNLSEFNDQRHWPTRNTDLSINFDTPSAVEKIVKIANSTIQELSKVAPLNFTLTGGRDTRMVIACARKQVNNAVFVTFAKQKQNPDIQIARSIAQSLSLNHQFIPTEEASEEELKEWLVVTGYSVSGSIWKIHKTFEKLDRERIMLPGTSAEVHKGNYWKASDEPNKMISASEILQRLNMPEHPQLVMATEQWLEQIRPLPVSNLPDLIHIEQRLGCWASVQPYGNQMIKFEVSVFNNREIFQTMMRLPRRYRKKKQLVVDVCKQEWPELLNFPFNQYPGITGYIHSKKQKLVNLIKSFSE